MKDGYKIQNSGPQMIKAPAQTKNDSTKGSKVVTGKDLRTGK